MPITQCLVCKKEFTTKKCHLMAGKSKYCSIACSAIGRSKPVYPVKCLACNKEFMPKHKKKNRPAKYCSIECAKTCKRNGETRNCKLCGKEFYAPKYKTLLLNNGIYCSIKCSNKDKRKPNQPLIIAIRCLEKYLLWRSTIFSRDKYTCQACGITSKSGRILNAHHKTKLTEIVKEKCLTSINDANSCSELWDLDNGITLCLNCHTLIHSNKKLQREIEL